MKHFKDNDTKVKELYEKIQDFRKRCEERGGMTPKDQNAERSLCIQYRRAVESGG